MSKKKSEVKWRDLSLSLSLSLTHTHTYTCVKTCTHTCMHTNTKNWFLLVAFSKHYNFNWISVPWKRASVMRISWEIRSISRDWLLYVSTMSRDFMKFIQARDDLQLLEVIPWFSCRFRITSTRSRRIDICVHTLSVTPCYIKHKSCS